MNRLASTLILAAAPLLAVGMVTQSESTSINSLGGNSASSQSALAAKQSFRGYWLDGSSFTQDVSYSPNGFSGSGIFAATANRTNFGGGRVASTSINSHQNFQRSQKAYAVSEPRKSGLDAQLANFNALYAYLTNRSGAVSPSVYHQLMDQQFAARDRFSTSARAHFSYGSIASAEKKSADVSAADLQMVENAAQHTEHAADIRDVTIARMKKTMQQRVYMQRPVAPQPSRLSGEAALGRAEQNRQAAFATMQVAYAGTKVFAEVAPLENLRRVIKPENSNNAGCENGSGDAKLADQIELKVRTGAPIK